VHYKVEELFDQLLNSMGEGPDSFNEEAYLRGHNLLWDVQFYMMKGIFYPETPKVVKTAIIEAHEEYFELPLGWWKQENFVVSDLTLKEKCLSLMTCFSPDRTFVLDRFDHELQGILSSMTDEEKAHYEAENKRIREMTNEEFDLEFERLMANEEFKAEFKRLTAPATETGLEIGGW